MRNTIQLTQIARALPDVLSGALFVFVIGVTVNVAGFFVSIFLPGASTMLPVATLLAASAQGVFGRLFLKNVPSPLQAIAIGLVCGLTHGYWVYPLPAMTDPRAVLWGACMLCAQLGWFATWLSRRNAAKAT
jgi:hypothetical protein